MNAQLPQRYALISIAVVLGFILLVYSGAVGFAVGLIIAGVIGLILSGTAARRQYRRPRVKLDEKDIDVRDRKAA